jgi:hypothetical protein
LIRWTCEINWGGGERPVFSLWDQEAQDVMQADRDETLGKAGAKFTNHYWTRAYRYQEGDLAPETAPSAVPPLPGAQFAEPGPPAEYADLAAATLATDAAPAVRQWLATLRAMLDSAESLEEFRARLLAAYPDLSSAALAAALGQAVTAAAVAGRYDIATEAGRAAQSNAG